jgi:hypothetical protein
MVAINLNNPFYGVFDKKTADETGKGYLALSIALREELEDVSIKIAGLDILIGSGELPPAGQEAMREKLREYQARASELQAYIKTCRKELQMINQLRRH